MGKGPRMGWAHGVGDDCLSLAWGTELLVDVRRGRLWVSHVGVLSRLEGMSSGHCGRPEGGRRAVSLLQVRVALQ